VHQIDQIDIPTVMLVYMYQTSKLISNTTTCIQKHTTNLHT